MVVVPLVFSSMAFQRKISALENTLAGTEKGFCISKDYLGPDPSFGPEELKRIFCISRRNYV
jgi:hypothetical protein